MAQGSGIPSEATLPVPYPFATQPWVDLKTGNPTIAFLNQYQLLWAAIFGNRGIVDLESYLIAAQQAPPFDYSSPEWQALIGRIQSLLVPADPVKNDNYLPYFPPELPPIATDTRNGISHPDGTTVSITADGTLSATGSGGTVTSVGLSLPTEFTVSGSPVTTSGTLTGVWANESANLLFAGPSSGAASEPSFRSLVTADFPNTAVTPGTYGDASHVGQFTVDSKGRLTFAANVAVSGGGGGYMPKTDGSEPPNLVSDGSGSLIAVPYSG